MIFIIIALEIVITIIMIVVSGKIEQSNCLVGLLAKSKDFGFSFRFLSKNILEVRVCWRSKMEEEDDRRL